MEFGRENASTLFMESTKSWTHLVLSAVVVALTPTFVPQAGASLYFPLHGKMVLQQANLGMMSRGPLASEAGGFVAACGGLRAIKRGSAYQDPF